MLLLNVFFIIAWFKLSSFASKLSWLVLLKWFYLFVVAKMTRYCSRPRLYFDVNVPFLFALKSSSNLFFIGHVCDFDGSVFDISQSTYVPKPKPEPFDAF